MATFAAGLPVPPELMGDTGSAIFGASPQTGGTPAAGQAPSAGASPAAQGDVERALGAIQEIIERARTIQDVVARVLPGSAGLVGLITQAAEALQRDIQQAQQTRARQSPEQRTRRGAGRTTPTEAPTVPPTP